MQYIYTMKLITLTQGKFAQVDDTDFEALNQFKWHACKLKPNSESWYARRIHRDNKMKSTYMHRQIMGCVEGDRKIIDHKDRNGLNCQRENMRFATYAENRNNRNDRTNPSGYIGVTIRGGRFRARLTVNKKIVSLGSFVNVIDAAIAYNEAALKYHGELARLNIITSEPLTS